MSDAYGTIVVCGNYRGNLNEIADALNLFEWNADYEKFHAYKDAHVVGLERNGIQYPTVFPERHILVLNDGRRYFADEADETTTEDWEAEGGEIDVEFYSLEQLSKVISPLLTKGTIEIVAVAYEKSTYAYYERLVIRSDGYAERHRHNSTIFSKNEPWSTCESEYFDPRTKKRAA